MPLLVQTAKALALWLHRDQVDKQGRPYVEHLQRVAARVEADGGTEAQIATAWLHDAMEDTDAEWEVIDVFPDPIPCLVANLTRGKGNSYSKYIDALVTHPPARPALLVKLADLEDNMDPERADFPDRERLMKRYRPALAKIEAALSEGR